jgi:hypothetical protein
VSAHPRPYLFVFPLLYLGVFLAGAYFEVTGLCSGFSAAVGARGATNREIAEALFISESTVKNHISSILSGLGLRDRTEAALYAHQHRLV